VSRQREGRIVVVVDDQHARPGAVDGDAARGPCAGCRMKKFSKRHDTTPVRSFPARRVPSTSRQVALRVYAKRP
jgi:hypothetical protein